MPYVSVVEWDHFKFVAKVNRDLGEIKILEYLHYKKQQNNHVI